jgi:hypothetical protein
LPLASCLDGNWYHANRQGDRIGSLEVAIHLCLECRGVSYQNSSSQCLSRYHLSESSVTSARTPDRRIHDWHIAFPSCNFNWMASLFCIAFVKSLSMSATEPSPTLPMVGLRLLDYRITINIYAGTPTECLSRLLVVLCLSISNRNTRTTSDTMQHSMIGDL